MNLLAVPVALALLGCPAPQPSAVTMTGGGGGGTTADDTVDIPGDGTTVTGGGTVAAGGGTAAARVPAPLSPALEPLAWLLGKWTGDGAEYWVAAAGTIYGIAIQSTDAGADPKFEVMIIDDGEGNGPPDGILRFIAMPGGTSSVEFRGTRIEGKSATFANPKHDWPREITYRKMEDDKRLEAVLGGIKGVPEEDVSFMPGTWRNEPELEEADREFAADVAQRGAAAWVDGFTTKGSMILGGEIVPHDQLAAAMGPTLAGGTLTWEPIASGMRGYVGFTVGIGTYTAAKPEDSWRSTYATIWWDDPRDAHAKTWKVHFDTGRVINE